MSAGAQSSSRTSFGEEGAEAMVGILSLALLSEITIGLVKNVRRS